MSEIRCFVLCAALLTAACSNTLPLSYAPTTAVPKGNDAVVGKVSATDLRNEPDRSWYGAIRGGYGNPLKVLHTSGPVSEDVAKAVRDALAQRGLLAGDKAGQFDMTVEIVQFEATQYVRREANVTLKLTITNRRGEIVYNDTARVDKVSGSVMALDVGVFGAPDELRQRMMVAMNAVIDELLDRPALRSVLRSGVITS